MPGQNGFYVGHNSLAPNLSGMSTGGGGGGSPYTPPANTILTSTDLGNAAWFTAGMTSLLKNAPDQNGTANSAFTALLSAGASTHVATGGTIGSLYTHLGVFGKAGTVKYLGVATSASQYVVFDVSAGTVQLSAAGCTGTVTVAAGGFFWCAVVTPNSASSAMLCVGDTAAHAVPSTNWTAAGTETLIMYNPSAQA